MEECHFVLFVDLQMVNITLRVLYKPDTANLVTVYKTLGTDYDERVLPSIGNEVLKSVVVSLSLSLHSFYISHHTR